MAEAVQEAFSLPGISQPPLFPANILEMQPVGRLCRAFGDDEDQVCHPWAFPSQWLLLVVLAEVRTFLSTKCPHLAMIFS